MNYETTFNKPGIHISEISEASRSILASFLFDESMDMFT
jgi:hypothetical protein